MAFDWSLEHILGVGTGVLILLLGVFVLLARPKSPLNRAFFVLALFDGASNILFELRNTTTDPALAVYFYSTFHYYFIAFAVALVVFGLLFPQPLGGPRWRPWLVGVPVGLGALGIGVMLLDPAAFFSPLFEPGLIRWPRGVAGSLLYTFYAVATGLVVLKLGRDTQHAPSLAMRRQAAFVLAGMVVGYTSLFTSGVASSFFLYYDRTFGSSDLVMQLFVWSYVAFTVAVIGVGARLVARRHLLDPSVRRFLLGAYLGAAALGALAWYVPSAEQLVQIISLLVYPGLLAAAIVGSEAFDINPQIRRATTLTLTGAGIAITFVLLENWIQGFVEENILDFGGDSIVVGIASALLAAAIVIPSLHFARKFVTRIMPLDMQHVRNLATYRLVLEGAMVDGLLDAQESRTLSALREALGITIHEHEHLLLAVRGASERATRRVPVETPTGKAGRAAARAGAPREP